MADRGISIPGDPMIGALITEAERYPAFKRQLQPLLARHALIVPYRNTLQLSDEAVDLYYRWVTWRTDAEAMEKRLNASLNVRKNADWKPNGKS